MANINIAQPANQKSGFTIIELLIVVVVIAILATITIVSYNGIQTRAQNAARYQESKSWLKNFELYKVTNSSYPAVANGEYCLGSGFPIGVGGVANCHDWNYAGGTVTPQSTNTALMTELTKVGSLPSAMRTPVDSAIGPYVIYQTTNIQIFNVFREPFDCPSDMIDTWSGGIMQICQFTITR